MSDDALARRRRDLLGSSLIAPPTTPRKPLNNLPSLIEPPKKQRTLNMSGPYELSEAEIAKHCSPSRPHGNYAFGSVDAKGVFLVSYVGRFNAGGKRLKHGIGKYKHFKISHAATEKEAVEKECCNYHDFMPPGNQIHPACPSGMCCPRGCP
jgi:hypothetical protein